MDNQDNILEGARTAFINESFNSANDFKPKFLSNNFNHKVLNSIKEELQDCDEFFISAAFITLGGLTPLLQDFLELEKRGIKGKILTTDYLNFTDPEALKKLQSLKNIEVKLYAQEKNAFHTKGYVFRKGNLYKGIVGSSNLTLNALTVNKEWNVEFTSLYDGEVLNNLLDEFNTLWQEANNLEDVLPAYEKLYNSQKNFTLLKQHYEKLSSQDLVPNSMQMGFMENLRSLIQKGESKALLVSATGTGKTYASAFAVQDFNPKKFLFVVHREQIAKQAINAYKNVFKDTKDFGLLTGNSKDYDTDYLFSTIQTLSKDDVYTKFKKDEFDYIVIDEVHKAGAFSYQKIMDYFEPKFYLGMTASPERPDGIDIYELFDHNLACEIRLKDALEEDLLCPFHYFGISDLEIDGEIVDDSTQFNHLVSNDRVNYLLEKSQYYGYSGDRIKALVFCSRKNEAKELAKAFNKRGHPSIVLTGDDSQQTREDAIYRLTNDEAKNKLEYIFTVDIFNEGVDIPEINQVLLVRPTQSPIIFIQQLGRGLRKFKNKDYVVIIDFIGNYKNNFMIPIALSGDRSYDKDNIRRYLMEGNKVIPGASSISFDAVSKKRIYDSINNASFSRIALFKEKYNNLKFKLGRIPMLLDFYENGEMDPLLILNHNAMDCYYSFLKKVDKDYEEYLSDEEISSLKFLSNNLADGKRPHELLILKSLIYNNYFSIESIGELLDTQYNIQDDEKSIKSAINLLNLGFSKKDKRDYPELSFMDDFKISSEFKKYLSHETYRKHILDLIDYALLKYKTEYNSQVEGENLTLYAKYSRRDACRLLNWPNDDSSTMYGYRVKQNMCPIFVTYNKKEDIAESIKYQDEFLSKDTFSWMTRHGVKLTGREVVAIRNYQKTNLKIHLFIKKSDDEGKDFYYIGQVTPLDFTQTTIKDGDKDLPIVNIKYKLHIPVKDELYDYFEDDIKQFI